MKQNYIKLYANPFVVHMKPDVPQFYLEEHQPQYSSKISKWVQRVSGLFQIFFPFIIWTQNKNVIPIFKNIVMFFILKSNFIYIVSLIMNWCKTGVGLLLKLGVMHILSQFLWLNC